MRRYWMTRCQPVMRRSGVIASETSSHRSAQMPVVSVMSSIGFALSRPVSPLKASQRNGESATTKTRAWRSDQRAVSSQVQLELLTASERLRP